MLPRSDWKRALMSHNRVRSHALLTVALVAACGPPADADSRGRTDEPAAEPVGQPAPRRIVSLIPAMTEVLFHLGAGDRLVGRTRWGVHPPDARRIPDVGDGIRPSLEAVLAREPDLVILYDGETNRDSRDRLRRLGLPTLALRHDTVEDLHRNILRLGGMVGCPEGGRALANRISEELAAIARAVEGRPRVRVYYDAWADPPMTIGGGSFLNSLLAVAGGDNVFGNLEQAAPRVSLEAIIDRDPDRILVPVAPEALDRRPGIAMRHGWEGIPAVAAGRISTLDRDLVSLLGPRVARAAWSIAEALHGVSPGTAPAPVSPSCPS